jgi:ubiquinone/menaquinone biosynthesis C-methylase UbiE
MKEETVGNLRCPVSKEMLTLSTGHIDADQVTSGELTSTSGSVYRIENGVPNFIYPETLMGSDAEFKGKYDKGANQYDVGLDWLFKSFYEDEYAVRNSMIDLMNLRTNSRVLETGCGTGKDSAIIASRLSSSAELHLLELSGGMISICKERMKEFEVPVEYYLGNAAYLPFPDKYFDSVFHFGGINTFSEKRTAIEEMTRVTKIGGTVVIGDESVPPWLKEDLFGKILINANPLYKYEVPLELLPACSRNVSVRWILGNAFYVVSYQVGEGAPPVDLDLPIPGKGDSLRLRYFGSAVGSGG